jgi:pectin methylesterase-like acyl-CoA thioesterase
MHPTNPTLGPCKSIPIAIAACCAALACSSTTGGGPGSGGNAKGGAATTTPPGGGGASSTTGGAGERAGGSSGSVGTGGVSGTVGSSGLGGVGGSRSSSSGSMGGGGASSTAGSTGVDSGQAGGNTGIGTSTGGSSSTGGARAAGGTGGGDSTGGSSSTGGASAAGGKGGSSGGSGSGGTSGTGGGAGGPAVCPAGIAQTITVAKNGSGQFTTVQAAVNSIASGSSTHTRIDIAAGTYKEKLTIASRTNLCLVGASATTTILTYDDDNAAAGGTSASASVYISANDFSAANLTFQNSFGSGSQAVALRATGQRQQFLNCRFVGYQDTLYTHSGSQYFRDCYVQGNTDYVFGGATAVLQNCEVRNVEGGSATSAPNTDIGTAYGIVFLGGKFTAASGVKANSVALARPWGADGFAAFLNADLGAHIAAAGFVTMSGNPPQNARFHEYGSTGSGANTSSRSSYQLTAGQAAGYTLANIFGSWTPTYSR